MPMNGRSRWLLVLLVALLAMTGCGRSAAAQHSPTPTTTPSVQVQPTASPTALAAQLAAANSALRAFTHLSSSYEPRGDISLADWRQGIVFFAQVQHVDLATRRITFDVEQFYRGTAAAREAARTGGFSEDQLYIFNQYHHLEAASLAKDVVPIWAGWGGGVEPWRAILNAQGQVDVSGGFWCEGGMVGTRRVIDMLVQPDVP